MPCTAPASPLISAPEEGTEGSGQEFPLLHLRVKNFLSEVEKKKKQDSVQHLFMSQAFYLMCLAMQDQRYRAAPN